MTDEELQELADDISIKGQLDDITLYQGKILDGRNRYLACPMAGVEPRFSEWDGKGSPLEWVISVNMVRRHLTSSQKAVIALDLLPLLEKEAKHRQRRSEGRGKKVAKKLATLNGKATSIAARMAKTNSAYVEAVKSIGKQAPELLAKIRSGHLRVPDAARLARLPRAERRGLLKRCNGQPLYQLEEIIGQDGKIRPSTFVFNGGSAANPRQNTIATPAGLCRFLHDLIAPKYKVQTILDPSAGASALTRPWKGVKVIAFEINKGKDFFDCPNHINADLVVCNPPFNSTNGETRFLPQLFLERIVKVVRPGTPIVLFSPMAMRLDQTTKSARWRWLRDNCPPITGIISLPHDAFRSVKVHAEILLFNMPKLEPHYFVPDKYLR